MVEEKNKAACDSAWQNKSSEISGLSKLRALNGLRYSNMESHTDLYYVQKVRKQNKKEVDVKRAFKFL